MKDKETAQAIADVTHIQNIAIRELLNLVIAIQQRVIALENAQKKTEPRKPFWMRIWETSND